MYACYKCVIIIIVIISRYLLPRLWKLWEPNIHGKLQKNKSQLLQMLSASRRCPSVLHAPRSPGVQLCPRYPTGNPITVTVLLSNYYGHAGSYYLSISQLHNEPINCHSVLNLRCGRFLVSAFSQSLVFFSVSRIFTTWFKVKLFEPCTHLQQIMHNTTYTTKLCNVWTRGGSISPLSISIWYRYFWPKISAISISFTAALCGLLIHFIITSKVVSDVNVTP